jgi:hypothetical protein
LIRPWLGCTNEREFSQSWKRAKWFGSESEALFMIGCSSIASCFSPLHAHLCSTSFSKSIKLFLNALIQAQTPQWSMQEMTQLFPVAQLFRVSLFYLSHLTEQARSISQSNVSCNKIARSVAVLVDNRHTMDFTNARKKHVGVPQNRVELLSKFYGILVGKDRNSFDHERPSLARIVLRATTQRSD